MRKVAFTGGAAGGRAVAALAGDRLTPAVLELGGNDPAVFLDDAPFDDAAMDRLVLATFTTGGQVRPAAKRLYVPAARLADFVDAYRAAARRVLVTGDPLDDGVTMGPVVSAAAQKAAEQLRTGDCRDLGRFDADPDDGYFVRPAVVVSPDPRDPLVTAEEFVPVVPVLGYTGEDEALAAADAGDPGLGASVWSADEERAVAFARRLEAGFAFVNTHHRTGLSLRREYAAAAFDEYARTCVIHAPASFRPGVSSQRG